MAASKQGDASEAALSSRSGIPDLPEISTLGKQLAEFCDRTRSITMGFTRTDLLEVQSSARH